MLSNGSYIPRDNLVIIIRCVVQKRDKRYGRRNDDSPDICCLVSKSWRYAFWSSKVKSVALTWTPPMECATTNGQSVRKHTPQRHEWKHTPRIPGEFISSIPRHNVDMGSAWNMHIPMQIPMQLRTLKNIDTLCLCNCPKHINFSDLRLPHVVRRLELDGRLNCKLEGLPFTLQSLTITADPYNMPLEPLQSLTLLRRLEIRGWDFNHTINGVLPQGIEEVVVNGNDFNNNNSDVSALPGGVTLVVLNGASFNQPVHAPQAAKVILKQNLSIFYDAHESTDGNT